MRITVLGGAGRMGCISVQGLAGDSRVEEVILADINADNARIVTEIVNSPKVTFQEVDVNSEGQLMGALEGADACLNATVYYTNLKVMDACRRAGVPYTDMGGLFYGTREQLKLDEAFAGAGVSAVLCTGSAPGCPNLQTRYAADRLDTIESIRIYDGIKPPPPDDLRFSYAPVTILDEIEKSPMVFEKGEFVAKPPLSGLEDYWFTPPVGLLPMHLSLHSEVATLPVSFADKGVKECFFKIDYWGMSKETIEKITTFADFGFDSEEPVQVDDQMVAPRDVMKEVLAQHVYSLEDMLAPPKNKPPDWTKEIVTEVHGTQDGEEVLYRLGTLTVKGALPTGIVPAITAIWLAEGRIEPGVHAPELALDPEPFFEELEAYDIVTQVSVTRKV